MVGVQEDKNCLILLIQISCFHAFMLLSFFPFYLPTPCLLFCSIPSQRLSHVGSLSRPFSCRLSLSRPNVHVPAHQDRPGLQLVLHAQPSFHLFCSPDPPFPNPSSSVPWHLWGHKGWVNPVTALPLLLPAWLGLVRMEQFSYLPTPGMSPLINSYHGGILKAISWRNCIFLRTKTTLWCHSGSFWRGCRAGCCASQIAPN